MATDISPCAAVPLCCPRFSKYTLHIDLGIQPEEFQIFIIIDCNFSQNLRYIIHRVHLRLLGANALVNAATVKLIRRCKNNDEDAYNQLISQHEAYLYRICYNYTRNKEDALDMMQEVYIKIFRGLKTFDETLPLLPWLKRVAINTLINQSKKKRALETSLDGSWAGKDNSNETIRPELYLSANSDIEEEVIYKDTRSIIDRLILELPESYRLALTLRYHEDMNYEEIASFLAQPLNTVKSSVYRARKMLRQKMQECELMEV